MHTHTHTCLQFPSYVISCILNRTAIWVMFLQMIKNAVEEKESMVNNIEKKVNSMCMGACNALHEQWVFELFAFNLPIWRQKGLATTFYSWTCLHQWVKICSEKAFVTWFCIPLHISNPWNLNTFNKC